MRRLLPLSAALLLAGCATAPKPEQAPSPVPTAPAAPLRTNLSGLTEAELVQRYGPASFRVREGVGLKLQWQNNACVFDAYLYPPTRGAGTATVLHVDARRPGSGETLGVEACLASFAGR